MTIAKCLEEAGTKLIKLTDSPQFEAELLLGSVLQKSRAFILSHRDDEINSKHNDLFHQVLAERLQGKPMAYILNRREFWSLELEVSSATLIPRPETETLVAMILEQYPDQKDQRQFLDLGTGSGAIALAIAKERPFWEIVATDVSQSALMIASKNAQGLALDRISFFCGNWCTALPLFCMEKFDIIASNPPYIAESEWDQYKEGLQYEPKQALVSGIDGLDAIREIVNSSRAYLKAEGRLFIEHGFRQGEIVRELFISAGFEKVLTHQDLAGLDRVTAGSLGYEKQAL